MIAGELKERNIAEYLLYMWQIEDLLRANGLNKEKVEQTLVLPCHLDQAGKEEMTRWYGELIDMMHAEGATERGHLQINRNILLLLTDLHLQLLRSPKVPQYAAAYYEALPCIVELRAKSGDADKPELETCFDALYGVMLLRLQKKEVSPGTAKAVEKISRLIALLAGYYRKERRGELEDLWND